MRRPDERRAGGGPARDRRTGPGAPADRFVVAGLGLRLPGVTRTDELLRRLGGGSAPPPAVRRFDAPGSDLEPAHRPAWGPVEPRLPAAVAGRGLRAVPYESRLALAAAGTARETMPGGGPVAVLWASSTAGLVEYATVCVEAATLSPGLCSPLLGPASAFNGPAATVSIRLGLDGPNETLTGGVTAGLSALAEAGRLITEGSAAGALVGGSATVSRWSVAAAGASAEVGVPADGAGEVGVPADGAGAVGVPADGAGCLALRPCRDGEPGVRLGRLLRLGLDPRDLVTEARDLVRNYPAPGAPPDGPLVVSAHDTDLVETVAKDHPGPVWHLERVLGDFGAAGGLLAAVCAVAHCVHTSSPARLLVLAVEPSGNAAIMEVSTWEASTLSSGCWAGTSPSGTATARRTSTATAN